MHGTACSLASVIETPPSPFQRKKGIATKKINSPLQTALALVGTLHPPTRFVGNDIMLKAEGPHKRSV
jgi:hypothetical protein